MVDPHTADGLKVGVELRSAGRPLVCLETALPAKFGATIQEALGREPERPSKFDGIEALPQRSLVIDANADVVKRIILEQAREPATSC